MSVSGADLFANGDPIPRDRYSRPLVVPPGGGKAIPYSRCTTYVGCLEDNYNLSRWQQRMVAIGLADRADLLLAAAAHRDDKDKLNAITKDAMEAAKAHAAATTGTAVHALTEQHDRGTLDISRVPAAYRPDVEAYAKVTTPLRPVMIEQFTVVDDLRVGGTPDRVVEVGGRRVIADIKTGSVGWSLGKISMQLAMYSRGIAYDHTTQARTPLDVDQRNGLIIHLPAGTGTCELLWVDIDAGWDGVQLATQVRAWRARKNLTHAYVDLVDLEHAIANAGSTDVLRAVWATHQAVWTDELTLLAKARRNLLEGNAAA